MKTEKREEKCLRLKGFCSVLLVFLLQSSLLLFPPLARNCWSMANTGETLGGMPEKQVIRFKGRSVNTRLGKPLVEDIVYRKTPFVLPSKLEQVILAEDWEKVVGMLPKEDEPNMPAAFRLIKGHACLATNRNNESLCLFLSVTSKEDLQEWLKSSYDFVMRHPKSHISHYFRGDALARLEIWDAATKEFSKALELHPNHPLILNARGTVSCAKGEWSRALIDLTMATISSDCFADAYASVGAMWVQRRAGPKGALRAFTKALKLSPDFAMAYNGKGCAEFALADWEKGNNDIARAGRYFSHQEGILPIISRNLDIITVAAKRAQFPFFSRFDFINWDSLRMAICDPNSILHDYFTDLNLDLPEEVDDAVISRFNKILEIPGFYDENKDKLNIPEKPEQMKPGLEELLVLIKETESLRGQLFNDLKEMEKERISKLNRLLLEYYFPKDLVQLAMNRIDAPGFSLERNIGLVDSWRYKNQLSNDTLRGGLNRMENYYRPLADIAASIPIVGPGLSNTVNRHLDNQIGINRDILNSRSIDTHSGGVDLSTRRAYIDEGNWGIGTWFGLAYHVEPIEAKYSK